jgi:biotin transport system substrate-specific component
MVNNKIMAILDVPESSVYSGVRKISTKLSFSIIFAVLMAVSANSFFYLPFTPVPVTMQVLTVLFSAIMLGGTWALTSQLIYISMGLSGLPVFAGFKSGPMVLAGPTAGYIIGFAIAAYFCGFLYQYLKDENRPSATSGIMAGLSSCITGIMIIYLFGFVHLFGFFLSLFPGQHVKDIISMTWKSGIEPFIIVDLLKVLIVINVLELGKKRK